MYYYISLLHKISVSLFLLIYLIKALLLFVNRNENLRAFSKKVKVPEMIISTLFLVTGIYMLAQGGHPETYMMVKILLVLVSIPLAVIGIRKEKKVFLGLSVLILIYVYGIAETHSLTFSKPGIPENLSNINAADYQISEHGKAIYQHHCMRCHGENGDKKMYESPDISQTQLSSQEQWEIISKGKGTMPAFGEKIDNDERLALEAYLIQLSKK